MTPNFSVSVQIMLYMLYTCAYCQSKWMRRRALGAKCYNITALHAKCYTPSVTCPTAVKTLSPTDTRLTEQFTDYHSHHREILSHNNTHSHVTISRLQIHQSIMTIMTTTKRISARGMTKSLTNMSQRVIWIHYILQWIGPFWSYLKTTFLNIPP